MKIKEAIASLKKDMIYPIYSLKGGDHFLQNFFIERLSQEYKEKIQFYKIDIDENEELSSTWNIKSVPTFYLLHKNNLLGNCSGADINKVNQLLLIIQK